MTPSQDHDQDLLRKRTFHFLQRQRERRIPCHDVLITLRFGHRHQHNGYSHFYSRGLYVIADRRGNLVTTYWL